MIHRRQRGKRAKCEHTVASRCADVPETYSERSIARSGYQGWKAILNRRLSTSSRLVEPDRVMPHHIVNAEAFVRIATLHVITPKFVNPPGDGQQRRSCSAIASARRIRSFLSEPHIRHSALSAGTALRTSPLAARIDGLTLRAELAEAGSFVTLRWRKPDSNHRSRQVSL
jgi:hypothetical protein